MSQEQAKRPPEPEKDALSTEPANREESSGYAIEGFTTDSGFAVQYRTPEGRDPYTEWDWIAVYVGNEVPNYDHLDTYINWNWTCPNEPCANEGVATIPNANHESGKEYTLVYFTWKWDVAATVTITAP